MTHRAPLTEAEKQMIGEWKKGGQSLRQISAELDCSRETVRKWWRCARDQRVIGGRGCPAHGPASSYSETIREKAIELKEAHPHWGPKKIRLELQFALSLEEKALPSPSRLSVLFKQRCPKAVQIRVRRAFAPSDVQVHGPHQRWQLDTKEGIPLGNHRAHVDEVRDVYSSVCVASKAFKAQLGKKGWQHLDLKDHRQTLREAFTEMGMPLEIQTDNDPEYHIAMESPFPTYFSLWLIGLGIIHILSRPHRPTDQAHIERHHRTQGDFAWEDQTFEQLEQLQQALDHHRQTYNAYYPSQSAHCHGRPPLSAFPTASTTGRPYHPDLEWDLFDLKRVDAFLAQQVWVRKVAENGIVHLGDHIYNLGRAWRAQLVSVRFCSETRSFRFLNHKGMLIVEHPALGLEKEHLIGLIPVHVPLPVGFQFSLPFVGV